MSKQSYRKGPKPLDRSPYKHLTGLASLQRVETPDYFLGEPTVEGVSAARRCFQRTAADMARTRAENRMVATKLKWMSCIPVLSDLHKAANGGISTMERKPSQRWFVDEDKIDEDIKSPETQSLSHTLALAYHEREIDVAMDCWLRLVAAADYHWYPERYVVCYEGTAANVWIILSGTVLLANGHPQSQSMLVSSKLEAGYCIGQDEVLSGSTMKYAIICDSLCEFLCIDASKFREIIAPNAEKEQEKKEKDKKAREDRSHSKLYMRE